MSNEDLSGDAADWWSLLRPDLAQPSDGQTRAQALNFAVCAFRYYVVWDGFDEPTDAAIADALRGSPEPITEAEVEFALRRPTRPVEFEQLWGPDRSAATSFSLSLHPRPAGESDRLVAQEGYVLAAPNGGMCPSCGLAAAATEWHRRGDEWICPICHYGDGT